MSLVRTTNMLYNARVKRTDSDQVLGEVEEVVAGVSCPVGRAKDKGPAAAEQSRRTLTS